MSPDDNVDVRPADAGRLLRFAVATREQLESIATALPAGLRVGRPARSLHRDMYLDTPDSILRRRGMVCRLRLGTDDRRVLSLDMAAREGGRFGAGERITANVRSTTAPAALAEDTSPGRRLRAVVDPATLVPYAVLEVDRLTMAAATDWLRRPRVLLHCDQITLREADVAGTLRQLCVHRLRGRGHELTWIADALLSRFGLAPGAPHPLEWAELRLKWARHEPRESAILSINRGHRVPSELQPRAPAEFLDPEIGLLAFQERVLAMAEDPRTPLQERLRFLAIVAANVDEYVSVRLAGLRAARDELTEDESAGEMTAIEQLEAVQERLATLAGRQARCWRSCEGALRVRGVIVASWAELAPTVRAALRERFQDEIQPALTPFAMTLSAGHPLPHLQHLALSMAVMLRDDPSAAARFAEVTLPETLPRFLAVDTATHGRRVVVPIEEVIRGCLDLLYPRAVVEQAHLFRVTRGGALSLDEIGADDMLEAVEAASGARPRNAAVRVEVERAMPTYLRDLILEDLRREPAAEMLSLGHDIIQPIDGLIDLRALSGLPRPEPKAGQPPLEFPPFTPSAPLATEASLLDAIRERDLLVHHPFDSFEATVLRFLEEAADDPTVTAIRITLYRVGDHSPVVAALTSAARQGKDVVAIIELKARFDEERNVRWARALERAGGRVVYGITGLKTHAKIALVVRRDADRLRRYVHVGTGNYDPRNAASYTDVGLFTADEDVVTDVAELFNELTGSAGAPNPLGRGTLVAPRQLLPALLERIGNEAAHARAGRESGITMKLNGLSDPDVVRALYRASQAGVRVDVICRGVCTLRPGVPGISERIRVISVVGRFLEHSRVLRFANGGDPVYLIGSADLRPRNLRRRVELLVPVRDAACRSSLDRLLALYLDDASAWELRADGSHVPLGGESGAQAALLRAGRSRVPTVGAGAGAERGAGPEARRYEGTKGRPTDQGVSDTGWRRRSERWPEVP